MRYIVAIALIVLAAGCLNNAPAAEAGCSDTGCPVDLPTTTNAATLQSASKCGNGILEASEECDINFPCKSGYCQKCRCQNVSDGEAVDNCPAACSKLGYKNSSVVDDAKCDYNMGADNPCALRCAFRKVFPSTQAGKVCCCRDLKYISCPVDVKSGKCSCPAEAEVTAICRQNKPDGNITGG